MILESNVDCFDNRAVDRDVHSEDEIGAVESMLGLLKVITTLPEISRRKIESVVVVGSIKLRIVVE
jgi:hypothetical protein